MRIVRFCISGVIVVTFYTAGIRILPDFSAYQTHKWVICLAVLTAGAILWPLGIAVNTSIAEKKSGSGKRRDIFDEEKSSQPFLLFDLAYWGLILIFLSATIVIIPVASEMTSEVVMARTNSPAVRGAFLNALVKPDAVATSTTTNRAEPEARASLKLQGLSYSSSNPSALIDGQTYFVGSYIGKAKVVAIEPRRVLLEQDGAVKALEFGK
jgi:hypothetical protein